MHRRWRGRKAAGKKRKKVERRIETRLNRRESNGNGKEERLRRKTGRKLMRQKGGYEEG